MHDGTRSLPAVTTLNRQGDSVMRFKTLLPKRAILFLGLLVVTCWGQAQNWPQKPIKLLSEGRQGFM